MAASHERLPVDVGAGHQQQQQCSFSFGVPPSSDNADKAAPGSSADSGAAPGWATSSLQAISSLAVAYSISFWTSKSILCVASDHISPRCVLL